MSNNKRLLSVSSASNCNSPKIFNLGSTQDNQVGSEIGRLTRRMASVSTTSTPVGSTPVGSTPVGSTPVGSTPVGSTPVGSTYVGSTLVGSYPLGSTPATSGRATSAPVASPSNDSDYYENSDELENETWRPDSQETLVDVNGIRVEKIKLANSKNSVSFAWKHFAKIKVKY
jgi:hypothetical protein